jgi:hypothetical protein
VDVWIEQDDAGPRIRVHTHSGAGSRDTYTDAVESMLAHPWCGRDADLDFTSTYADLWFRPDPAQLDPTRHGALAELDPVDSTLSSSTGIRRARARRATSPAPTGCPSDATTTK